MSVIENLAIVLALCALLSLISYKFGLLTASGSAASFVMGVVIGVFGSINWLIMLIAFALAGFVVTRYKIDVKMKNGLQEGKKGERTYKNVFANAFVPALIAVISYAAGMQNQPLAVLAYLCSISVAAADTIASELGVLSPQVRLITNFKKVPAGTDGGISVYGTFWAIMASMFVSIAGWVGPLPGDGHRRKGLHTHRHGRVRMHGRFVHRSDVRDLEDGGQARQQRLIDGHRHGRRGPSPPFRLGAGH